MVASELDVYPVFVFVSVPIIVLPFSVSSRSNTVPLLLVTEYMLIVLPPELDELSSLAPLLLLAAVATLLLVDDGGDGIVASDEDDSLTFKDGWAQI
jgi:hypothetical protein